MEHLVTLITGVAWPITLLVFAYLFRKEISRGFSKLIRIKYKDFEAEFGETLKQIEDQVPEPELEDEGDIFNAALVQRRQEIRSLAAASPRVAILESWIELERALLTAAKNVNIPVDRGVHKVVNELVALKYLTPSYSKITDSLRRLRNMAVHEIEIELTQSAVDEYVYVALNLAASIDAHTNPEHSHHLREKAAD